MITLDNIVFEAMVENLLVSRDCIYFRKDPMKWKRHGCYGFPATILIFSIADMIGSYILGGRTRNHFNIFKDKSYYNFELNDNDLNELYDNYRCLVTHNGALPLGRLLDIGNPNYPVIGRTSNGDLILYLIPFWNVTYYAVEKFLSTVTLKDNDLANKILSIPKPIK
jgi:hypothetical protein